MSASTTDNSRRQLEQVTIRLATERDATVLADLATRLTTFQLPLWRAAIDIATADTKGMLDSVRAGSRDDQVFIAERSRSVVGCLHMQVPTDFFGRRHAHISVIATTKEAEGSGVGRVLLAYAETWARERQLSLLTLNVFDANQRARRFYERAGFAPEIVKYAKPLDLEHQFRAATDEECPS